MNVLMLHLPEARSNYLGAFSVPEPVMHLYLGRALAPRHELRFVDLRLDRDLAKALHGFRPDAVIVGVGLLSFGTQGKTLTQLRALFPKIKILFAAEAEYGNSHIGERPLDFAHSLADAIVQPFFVNALQQIVPRVLDAWETEKNIDTIPGLWTNRGGRWEATSEFPNRVGEVGVPDRRLLGRYRGRYRFAGIGRMAHTFYTYGCKFKCRFCPMSKHDGTIVARPIQDIIAELRELEEPFVFLQDYEPFLAPEAMERLAHAVEKAGIKKRWYMLTRSDTAVAQRDLIARWQKIGLRWIYLGLDAHNPERIREIRKGNTIENNEKGLRAMQGLGLAVTVGFPVSPDYSREDFAELRAYVKKLRPPLFDFTVETPLVGTTWFDEVEGKLTTKDWSLYDLGHAVIPTRLPRREFYREMAGLHRFAMWRDIPGFLRHYPLRDFWINGLATLRAFGALGRGGRDHESGIDLATREAEGLAV